MKPSVRLLCAGACMALILGLSNAASADPEDHTDSHGGFNHDGQPPESAPFVGPQSKGMPLVGNSDKDGTVNSDLAFWGNLVFTSS